MSPIKAYKTSSFANSHESQTPAEVICMVESRRNLELSYLVDKAVVVTQPDASQSLRVSSSGIELRRDEELSLSIDVTKLVVEGHTSYSVDERARCLEVFSSELRNVGCALREVTSHGVFVTENDFTEAVDKSKPFTAPDLRQVFV